MKPLEGRVVLVTRPTSSAREFIMLLEEAGAKVMHLPMMEIADPDSWEECDRAIMNLRFYDGILFTSKNAVEKFVARVHALNTEAFVLLMRCAIYAVGEKTEEALEELGIPVSGTPEIYGAEDLATSFTSEQVEGKRFLFPKSNIARDVLPNALREMDAVVDEIVVYKTVAPRQVDLDSIRNALATGSVDIVTFFSPSSVRNFVQMFGHNCLGNLPVAVLGPTTEAAALSVGVTATIVPSHATSESLIDSLVQFFSTSEP
jgi:uroporphyrinogen III methyltransferase/synthase